MKTLVKSITPKDGTFWSTFFSGIGTFFAPGPTALGNSASGSGLEQTPGTQGNLGVSIYNEQAALQVATVWACVRLLAELVGSLPVSIYRRTAEGRIELRDHPLHSLIHDSPNPLQTKVQWLEQQMLNILLDGNCYDYAPKAGTRTLALYPLAANQVSVKLDTNGVVTFRYEPGGGVPAQTFTQRDIIHTRLFGNGLRGLSPMGYARQTILNAQQLQQNSSDFASKGNKPSGILMVDHVLKPGQREAVRTNFKEIEENNARLFVLEAGMKYQQLTITPEEAQMMEQRRFSIQDICRIYRVPSYMVNDSEKATTWGTGLEQMNLSFLTYTLRPYLTRFEQEWNLRLLTDQERAAGIYFEFNLDALLRADSKGRADFYSTMVQNGLMTRNEVRRKENLPASIEGNSDSLTVQVNLTTLDKLGASAPQPNGGQ